MDHAAVLGDVAIDIGVIADTVAGAWVRFSHGYRGTRSLSKRQALSQRSLVAAIVRAPVGGNRPAFDVQIFHSQAVQPSPVSSMGGLYAGGGRARHRIRL